MTGEYTKNLRYPKSQLREAAEKLAQRLGIPLQARTKAELSSFLVVNESKEKPECSESPDGKHSFAPDYEYDSTGHTTNCEHCGAPEPPDERSHLMTIVRSDGAQADIDIDPGDLDLTTDKGRKQLADAVIAALAELE